MEDEGLHRVIKENQLGAGQQAVIFDLGPGPVRQQPAILKPPDMGAIPNQVFRNPVKRVDERRLPPKAPLEQRLEITGDQEVARSFGIEAFRVTRRDQVDAAIKRLLAAEGAILAHVCIDPKTNVWPLVPPGETNDVMLEGMSA